MTTETNPFSPEMKQCPYPGYDQWRSEAPLVWSDEVKAWLVTSYDVAKSILDDSQHFSSGNSVFGGPALTHPEFPSMINRDEPDHRKLRSLVSKAFTPRTIEEAWEPRIKEYVDELLDAVEQRGNGHIEVVGDLAYPLPVQMIAEIIGIPPALHAQFKHWSNLIVQDIGRIIKQLNRESGMTIMFVEQNLDMIKALAQRCYVMDKGRIVAHVTPQELEDRDTIRKHLAV